MTEHKQHMDRFHRELEEYLDQQNVGEGEDLQKYLDQFMSIYNERLKSGYKSKLDIALEKFYTAESPAEKEKRAYGVLKYDPYHFDARWIIEFNKTKDFLGTYEKLLNEDEIRLAKEGYETGKYYSIYETREFIQKLYEYMELLIEHEYFEKAIETGEKIMRLNENDNTGSRFHLMHLYAYLDKEQEAKQLYEYSIDKRSCMYLMPLACIAYNRGRLEEAERYFQDILKYTKDAKRYLRAMKNDREHEFLPTEVTGCYKPFSWEELYYMFEENWFLYEAKPEFMKWVYQQVRLVKKS